MSKVLVIADTHINPELPDDELWHKLGQYCVRTKPDYVIHLGDVADFNSQAWLKAQRGMFTLQQELLAVEECLIAFEHPIKTFNIAQRESKHKQYKPKLILTLGNHDVRNDITDVAELFEDYGWTVYNYLEPCNIDGVTFVHAAHKGLSDSFCTTAQELIENWHSNIVVGHGHHKDFFESFSLATDEIITALRSPCFMTEPSEWAVQTKRKWSTGFTEINTKPFSFVWKDISCL